MNKLCKIKGFEEISNFITNTSPGTVLWIMEIGSQNACLAILERHCYGADQCYISKGPGDRGVLNFECIFEIAEVPMSYLVFEMSRILQTSFNFE